MWYVAAKHTCYAGLLSAAGWEAGGRGDRGTSKLQWLIASQVSTHTLHVMLLQLDASRFSSTEWPRMCRTS